VLVLSMKEEELDGRAVSALSVRSKKLCVSYWMGDQQLIISSSSVLRKAR
jgi:hypothetical protein